MAKAKRVYVVGPNRVEECDFVSQSREFILVSREDGSESVYPKSGSAKAGLVSEVAYLDRKAALTALHRNITSFLEDRVRKLEDQRQLVDATLNQAREVLDELRRTTDD